MDDQTKIEFAGTHRVIGTFSIFDVETRSIPSDDSSRFVAQGTGAEQEPTIYAVVTAQTSFYLTLPGRSQDRSPILRVPVQVVRMIRNLPAPGELPTSGLLQERRPKTAGIWHRSGDAIRYSLPDLPGVDFDAAWRRRVEGVIDAASG